MKEMNKRQESELSARDREIASLMETIREKDDDIEVYVDMFTLTTMRHT